MLTQSIVANPTYEFAADVRAGLTRPQQKELLSKYLYDDVGSALFEVISFLPEYGLTRADERLLRRHARDIVEYLPGLLEVAAQRRHGQHLLVLFLGSTIGNFDRPAGVNFLREVRRTLAPG